MPVWSAYAPLDVHGLSWAILAEIDQEEAEGPLVGIKQRMAIALVIIAFLVAAVGYVFSRTITRPVEKLRALLDKVARGDLSERPDIDSKDEVGQMAVSISQMVDNVAEMLESIQASSRTLATSSQEIAANSQDLSNRTQEQAAALEETSSTIEELSATIKGNADRAERANAMATKTLALSTQVSRPGLPRALRRSARRKEKSKRRSQLSRVMTMVSRAIRSSST